MHEARDTFLLSNLSMTGNFVSESNSQANPITLRFIGCVPFTLKKGFLQIDTLTPTKSRNLLRNTFNRIASRSRLAS